MKLLALAPALYLASALPALAAVTPPSSKNTAPITDSPQVAFTNSFNFQLENAVPWISAGNGMTNAHFAANEFILGKYTLPFISERWVFTAGGEVQSTPTVEGDYVYVADNSGTVSQLNAVTGRPVWQTKLPAITGIAGSYSRNSPALGANIVIVGDQASATLIALSKTDGSLVWKQTLSTRFKALLTSSAVDVDGQIFVGVASGQEGAGISIPNFVPDFRGSVAALDDKDGHILWQTYTVPTGYTGGSVWGSNLGVDLARGAIYAATGNNYSVPPSVAACQAAATTPAQKEACIPPDNHIDSILSLDIKTGAIKWAQRTQPADTWEADCVVPQAASLCPMPTGPDSDFGAGPNLFTINIGGTATDVVGAGNKAGSYYTLSRDTGQVIWSTQAGPGSVLGGIQWGTATDGQRIYTGVSNADYAPTTLTPSGRSVSGGFWTALDAATGKIVWQTPTFSPPAFNTFHPVLPPEGATALAPGAVSVANGVMYGEDTAGNFVALDAQTGQVLRTVQSGGAGISAPAIVDGVLYWASGYGNYGPTNNKVYAFWIGLQ